MTATTFGGNRARPASSPLATPGTVDYRPDFENMSVAGLRKWSQRLKVEGYSRKSKEELAELVTTAWEERP